eukprot:16427237-Heterocapsa_arctica.AAC.1
MAVEPCAQIGELQALGFAGTDLAGLKSRLCWAPLRVALFSRPGPRRALRSPPCALLGLLAPTSRWCFQPPRQPRSLSVNAHARGRRRAADSRKSSRSTPWTSRTR